MTPELMIQKLLDEGGAIVGSDSCSPVEISMAKSMGRFSIMPDGCGILLRSSLWVKMADDGLAARLADYALVSPIGK